MPNTEPEQENLDRVDTSKTATEALGDKSSEQRQIDDITKAVLDLDERFKALTNFLEIRISEVYKKYDVYLIKRGLGRGLVNPDGMSIPPKKKWYQFWK